MTQRQHDRQAREDRLAKRPVSEAAPATNDALIWNGTLWLPGAPTPAAHTHSHDTELTGVSANDHHNQAHAVDGADHTGNLTQARSHDSPDTDTGSSSLHHTIGTLAAQAAAGNHTHANAVSVFDRIVSDTAVTNTASETTLYSKVIDAGSLGTNKRLRLTIEGKYLNNSGAGRTLQVKLKYGATTLIDVTSISITNTANERAFKWVAELSARDATNSQFASLVGQMASVNGAAASGTGDFYDASAVANYAITAIGTAAEDSAAEKQLVVTVTHSAADANLTVTLHAAILELL